MSTSTSTSTTIQGKEARPNSGSLQSPIQAIKKILGLRYLTSILGTLRRIRLERPDESINGESGANQILLELQMTDELLERINFFNTKAKSFQYRLQLEIEETPNNQELVTA